MYGITATHYLTGIAPGLLLFVPPMEIFLDLHPVDLSVGFGSGCCVRRLLPDADPPGVRDPRALPLGGADAGRGVVPDLRQALYQRRSPAEQKWHVTGSTTAAASPFNFIIPQVLAFVFLLLTSVVAVWQVLRQGC